MTDKILEKANELKSEISDIEKLKYFLINFTFHAKGRLKKKVRIFAKNYCREYDIEFPKELQSKILAVVEEYLSDKKREYNKLGKEL